MLDEVRPQGPVVDVGTRVDLEAEFARPARSGDEDLLPADTRDARGEVGEWFGYWAFAYGVEHLQAKRPLNLKHPDVRIVHLDVEPSCMRPHPAEEVAVREYVPEPVLCPSDDNPVHEDAPPWVAHPA